MRSTTRRIRSLVIAIIAILATNYAISFATGVSQLPDAPRPRTGVSQLPDAPRPKTGVSQLPDAPRPKTGVSQLPDAPRP